MHFNSLEDYLNSYSYISKCKYVQGIFIYPNIFHIIAFVTTEPYSKVKFGDSPVIINENKFIGYDLIDGEALYLNVVTKYIVISDNISLYLNNIKGDILFNKGTYDYNAVELNSLINELEQKRNFRYCFQFLSDGTVKMVYWNNRFSQLVYSDFK